MRSQYAQARGAVVLGAMFLASCSLSTPVSDLRKAARTESTQPAPDVSKRSTVVEAIPVPYSQMSVRINGGLAGRMVLASRIHGVEKWIAADGLTIWLRNHRIVGTQGFHQDLLASERLDDRSGPGKAFTSADSGTVSAVHYAELVGEPLGSVVRYTRRAEVDTQPVLVDGAIRLLRRVVEIAESKDRGEWQNIYWIDADAGTVELSVQQVPGTDQTVFMQRIYPD
ncbi:YjbF family lipoprotein [Algiphilus sp.]|uniref:YjbF family lipoprotein n=1 Tax=Algiphilus sp. TaxID=1872431 RepID=UPI0032EAC30D